MRALPLQRAACALLAALPLAAAPAELVVQSGHSSRALSVAFSPDGALLASSGEKGDLKLWDVRSGLELRALSGHTDAVQAVAFTPDGKTLASASRDGSIRLWDVASGRQKKALLRHGAWVDAVGFSPAGQLASAGHDRSLRLWDLATGIDREVALAHYPLALAFSPDGKLIAVTGLDGFALLVDAGSATPLRRLEGVASHVFGVAFSPDGASVLTSTADGRWQRWDTATGKLLASVATTAGAVHGIAVSRPGGRIATAAVMETNTKTRESVVLWSAAGEREGALLEDQVADGVSFSPDGALLAAATWDEVRLWDVASRREVRRLRSRAGAVRAVAMTDTLVGIAAAQELHLASLETGRQLPVLPTRHSVFALSRDGARVVTVAPQALEVRAVATGAVLLRVPYDDNPVGLPEVICLGLSPDGGWLAVSLRRSGLQLIDAATGAVRARPALDGDGPAVALAFSADGRVLAAASEKHVGLFSAATGERVRSLEYGGLISSLALSPDGQHLAVGDYSSAKVVVWQTATGLQEQELPAPSRGVRAVAFSGDGLRVLAGCEDGALATWEVASGQRLQLRIAHPGGAFALAFSPDGRLLLSGGADGTARLASGATGEELARLVAATGGETLFALPDNSRQPLPRAEERAGGGRLPQRGAGLRLRAVRPQAQPARPRPRPPRSRLARRARRLPQGPRAAPASGGLHRGAARRWPRPAPSRRATACSATTSTTSSGPVTSTSPRRPGGACGSTRSRGSSTGCGHGRSCCSSTPATLASWTRATSSPSPAPSRRRRGRWAPAACGRWARSARGSCFACRTSSSPTCDGARALRSSPRPGAPSSRWSRTSGRTAHSPTRCCRACDSAAPTAEGPGASRSRSSATWWCHWS